uniref:Small ribosomal subunit protein uS2 n=1 Tax=Mycoplasma feriruminatoris TaxID=1179777 RepID=A0A654IJM6_9MOLU|nr:30S ribosomal protein S2 [Mycoplasma feriruminatoris]
MHKLPAAIVVVDPKGDEIAVKEARKLNIPVIAICDTNADPDMIDYVIPGNDDLQESVNLIINILVEAYAEGAQIKMNPSVLKTVAPKREPRQNRLAVNTENTSETTTSESTTTTSEQAVVEKQVEKVSEPKAE